MAISHSEIGDEIEPYIFLLGSESHLHSMKLTSKVGMICGILSNGRCSLHDEKFGK